MKRVSIFYAVIAGLTVLDSFLLSKPNLLGKIGLIIYKYHYLRTFPRTLMTVSIVVIISLSIAELTKILVKNQTVKRATGKIILSFLILLSAAALIKTGMDFSGWTYNHTGHRFKYGAYLLPFILISIFTFALISLPKLPGIAPVETINNEPSDADNKS